MVGDDEVRATPISVASARYFPIGDGKGDEAYEVVLRNDGSTPVVLSATFLDGRELKSTDLTAVAALKSLSFDVGWT